MFDLPTAPQGVPWLVYPLKVVDSCVEQKFYSVADGQIEERKNHHFRHSNCLTNSNGWMLMQNERTRKVFMYNPFYSRRCCLPRFNGEDPDLFVILSTPEKPDCFIVAAYLDMNRPYFLHAQPRGKKWEKYDLEVEENFDLVRGVQCNGKVYLYSENDILVVIHFTPLPKVEYLDTTLASISKVLGAYEFDVELVASYGELFLILKESYTNTDPPIPRNLVVFKLNFSSMIWEIVDTLDESVFVICNGMAASIPAGNTKLRSNCVYIVEENVLHCFDIENGSLTTSYPCSDASYQTSHPFWLLPDDKHMNQQQSKKEANNSTSSSEKFLYDLPKFLLTQASNTKNIIYQSKPWGRWCPRTPWLMFTHKDNGTYKVLDPCSKAMYELNIPDLSGTVILASKGGWLFAKGKPSYHFYFINPFTKERIDVPQLYEKSPYGATFSSTPNTSDCIVFCVSQKPGTDETVIISVYTRENHEWKTENFDNNIPFKLSHKNVVYLNECFYCLGMNGNLGVYDPKQHSWRIIRTSINIEQEVYDCTLVESCGKLLSIFIDLFQRPIGVFEFDMDLWAWKRINHLGNKTLFIGHGASFIVWAATESMKNMIYFSTFEKECSFDLVKYSVSSKESVDFCTKPQVGYIHVWIEPKHNVLCGSGCITSKVCVS